MFYRSGRLQTLLMTQIPGLATLHHCRRTSIHQSRISLENWLQSNQIKFLKKSDGLCHCCSNFLEEWQKHYPNKIIHTRCPKRDIKTNSYVRGRGAGGRVLLIHAHGFLLPVDTRNYSRFNFLSVIDKNFYPYS